jgi:hypothetical protein
MNQRVVVGILTACLSLTLFTASPLHSAQDDPSTARTVPEAFARLEYLPGQWKGQGVPKNDPANSFRGWTEIHSWAWVFQDGKPVALALSVEGGRIFASGKLTYDPARKLYRLAGLLPSPAHGEIFLEGTLDSTGKRIVLESIGKLPHYAGTIRLTMGPNANFVRYTIREDRKEPGGSQFRPFIEVGLTKEGESFASGTTAAERAKCIITGAASTMMVNYEGASYPVCCTGCRDEFLESPQKYIKKASLMLKAEAAKSKSGRPSSTSRVSRLEDAFAGDVAEPEPAGKADAATRSEARIDPAVKPAASKMPTATAGTKPARNPAAKKQGSTPASKDKDADRAASLLKIAENLEKNGGNEAALSYYRRIVKDYPRTLAAKMAGERIKLIRGRSD